MIFEKLIVVTIIILTVTFYNSCEKLTDPISGDKFQISVDSLHVPETVSLSDTVICRFWGFIGSNLCYQFSHFETGKNLDNIYLKLWGYHSGADICATAISSLSGKEYKFAAEQQGIIIINILQPDNSVLKDSVLVQ